MKNILITGGAGFIGVNTAFHYAKAGDSITILDAFTRQGTRQNFRALKKAFPKIKLIETDIRDEHAVLSAVTGKDIVLHFAGQVAVTTSVTNPREDFFINAVGTFNVLEAVRKQKKPPILLYSSTNKVYGGLEHLKIVEKETRYVCPERPEGIDEQEPLDFHSPYGCSKGAADQYVRDYARMYNLPTLVFRQSCIYGTYQYGIEDQGWVAWFLIAAMKKKPITIYGNGKQVRDILWIDDLVKAYDLAIEKINTTKGQIYNIGGGIQNTLSVWKEFNPKIEKLLEEKITVSHEVERPGDQPYFVANCQKAFKEFGWKPTTSVDKGLASLHQWLTQTI